MAQLAVEERIETRDVFNEYPLSSISSADLLVELPRYGVTCKVFQQGGAMNILISDGRDPLLGVVHKEVGQSPVVEWVDSRTHPLDSATLGVLMSKYWMMRYDQMISEESLYFSKEVAKLLGDLLVSTVIRETINVSVQEA